MASGHGSQVIATPWGAVPVLVRLRHQQSVMRGSFWCNICSTLCHKNIFIHLLFYRDPRDQLCHVSLHSRSPTATQYIKNLRPILRNSTVENLKFARATADAASQKNQLDFVIWRQGACRDQCNSLFCELQPLIIFNSFKRCSGLVLGTEWTTIGGCQSTFSFPSWWLLRFLSTTAYNAILLFH